MIPALPARGRRRRHASPGVISAVTPLHAVAARRVAPARSWGGELLREILPVVILTRLLFVALTLLTPLWRLLTGAPPLAFFPATGTALDAWNRWDARWYADLARLGYNIRGPNGFKNVAFFPLDRLPEPAFAHDPRILADWRAWRERRRAGANRIDG